MAWRSVSRFPSGLRRAVRTLATLLQARRTSVSCAGPTLDNVHKSKAIEDLSGKNTIILFYSIVH